MNCSLEEQVAYPSIYFESRQLSFVHTIFQRIEFESSPCFSWTHIWPFVDSHFFTSFYEQELKRRRPHHNALELHSIEYGEASIGNNKGDGNKVKEKESDDKEVTR